MHGILPRSPLAILALFFHLCFLLFSPMASSSVATIPISLVGNRPIRTRPVFSRYPSFSSYATAADDPNGHSSRNAPCSDPAGSSESPTAERARQSRILDRWAAHQAREMITTIERQVNREELSALSSTCEPVSVRAKSLLCTEAPNQPSPTPTPRKSKPPPVAVSCGGTGGEKVEEVVRPNVRASSLIQMWRELEAEAGATPRSPTNRAAFSVEQRTESFEVIDYAGWDSDLAGPSESEREQQSAEEDAKKRVGQTVEQVPRTATNKRSEQTEGTVNGGLFRETLRKRRQRWDATELIPRLEKERRAELERVAGLSPVSGFSHSHRRRIQTFLRLRSMRQEAAAQGQRRPESTKKELNQLQRGVTILVLRQKFSSGHQEEGATPTTTTTPAVEKRSRNHMELSDCSLNSDHHHHPNTEYPESTIVMRDSDTNYTRREDEEVSFPSRSEDMQAEGSQNSDAASDEGSLQVSNIDWERPVDPSSAQSIRDDDLIDDEAEVGSEEQAYDTGRTWLTCGSPSWESRKQEMYSSLLETYSDNAELRELLERRTVSISLASEFREKLDLLIMSTVQGRQSDYESFDHDDEQSFETYNDGLNDSDQIGSSYSLVPVSFQPLCQPNSLQNNSYDHYSSDHNHERDPRHDSKDDISHIYREMSELRKLIELCMEKQDKLQYSVKQEVTNAVRNLVGMGDASHSSKRETTKKGCCCICYDTKIDSLLYRCGHMCTCFDCAQELQWSSGKCPICRAPIVDVVRAHLHS